MTLTPSVTGTSVVALKYKGGVMLACDTLGSYGTMARFKDVRRVFKSGRSTLVAGDGELSDLQFIEKLMEELHVTEVCHDDGNLAGPRDALTYLARLLYRRRTNVNPLWNSVVVAGWDEQADEPFLGTTDMIGTVFEENFVATGLGTHMALPLLRAGWRPDLSEGDARALLEQCMRVLYYRDTTTINRITFAKATAGPTLVVEEPVQLRTEWGFRSFVVPRAEETGSW